MNYFIFSTAVSAIVVLIRSVLCKPCTFTMYLDVTRKCTLPPRKQGKWEVKVEKVLPGGRYQKNSRFDSSSDWHCVMYIGQGQVKVRSKCQDGLFRFDYDSSGFNSDGWLPRWQLCHRPHCFLVGLTTKSHLITHSYRKRTSVLLHVFNQIVAFDSAGFTN